MAIKYNPWANFSTATNLFNANHQVEKQLWITVHVESSTIGGAFFLLKSRVTPPTLSRSYRDVLIVWRCF